MGYSCTTKAMETLERMFNQEVTGCKVNNGFKGSKGFYCFYEIGRENEDGAITGSIMETNSITEDYGESCRCKKAGSFRIEPDGSVTRFPRATKAMLIAAKQADDAHEFSRNLDRPMVYKPVI